MSQGSPEKQEDAAVDEMKLVETIQFTKESDPDLMDLINAYSLAFNRHVMSRTRPRNVIRNLLLRVLPKETEGITKSNSNLATN